LGGAHQRGHAGARRTAATIAPIACNPSYASQAATLLISPQAALAVATAVPFFDDLTSLIGALQTPLVGFCIPAALYACGRRATPCHCLCYTRRPPRLRQAPIPPASVLTTAYRGVPPNA